MPRSQISLAEARRIAIAAQGLARPRPAAAPDLRHIRRALTTIGALQLDFVNVLVPAHYLVLYSRLGPYDVGRLHALVYRRREFIEQWAHEASIVPLDCWPLLAHRRASYKPYPHHPVLKLPEREAYCRQVMEIVREQGPVTSADLPPAPPLQTKADQWTRSLPRWSLEFHFGRGDLAVSNRLPNFQREYDLPERVIKVSGTFPAALDAQRALLRRAAAACGIATARDLADYYRLSPRQARPLVSELVEEGTLREVRVEGWAEPGYLSHKTSVPRKVETTSLLSPFDPLVWFRPRAERLFDFHYRLEIYTPASKRKWGYYVLPFLLDERVAGRVDLKANRRAGTLEVRAAYAEAGIDRAVAAERLTGELRGVADWLGLEQVAVLRRGNLADALRRLPGVRRLPAGN